MSEDRAPVRRRYQDFMDFARAYRDRRRQRVEYQPPETPAQDQLPVDRPPGGLRSIWSTFFTPWRLPPGVPHTDDMTEEGLVAEAREDLPFLREFGWHDSGLFDPARLNKQYLRVTQYLGKVPLKPYVFQYLTPVVAGIPMAILGAVGPSQQVYADLNPPVWFSVGIMGGTGSALGLLAGLYTRCVSQFWRAYAHARIAQKDDIEGGRRTAAIYELPLLRMAFIDRRSEQLFSGVDQASGFGNGRMNLETYEDLSAVTDPRTLYEPGILKPCRSTFTGVNTARRHALTTLAKEMGKIAAEKKRRLRRSDFLDLVGEHKGLTALIVCSIIGVGAQFIGIEWAMKNPTEAFSGIWGG